MALSQDVFDQVNIPIRSLVSGLNEKTGTASFQIDFGFTKLTPIFNSSLSGTNYDALLFFNKGNTYKNNWFNDPYASLYKDCSKDQTALLFIATKELGDLLQAYYAKEYLAKMHYKDRKTVSLFTNDKLLTRRCQLYGVPVVLTTTVKIQNTNRVCYYVVPAMDSVASDMLVYYRRCIKDTNNNTIRNIKNAIDNGYYKLRNGDRVVISPYLKDELLRLCSVINKRVNEFLSNQFDHKYMRLEEFRQISCEYISTNIIDKLQLTFNALPDALFIAKKDSELVRLKTMIQTGGNKTSEFKFDMSIEPADFTSIRWIQEDEEGDMLEHYSFQTITLNIIFDRLKLRYPEKSKDELCFLTCDVYAILRIYFTYLGPSPLQRPFYDTCIRLFETRLPSFQEFAALYAQIDSEFDLTRYPSSESIWAKLEQANAAAMNTQTKKTPTVQHPVLVSRPKRRTYKAKRLGT